MYSKPRSGGGGEVYRNPQVERLTEINEMYGPYLNSDLNWKKNYEII